MEKSSPIEGECSRFWGEVRHLYGAIIILGWPLNTLSNQPSNLDIGQTAPFSVMSGFHLPESLHSMITYIFLFLLDMYHFFLHFFTFPNSQKSCFWLQIFTGRQSPLPANKLADHKFSKINESSLTTCRRAERLAPLLCLPLCNHWR